MSYVLMGAAYPKARKEHKCIWCGERIDKGEQHLNESSIYDEHWQRHRWHLECDADARNYFRETHEDSFDPHEAHRPDVSDQPFIECPTCSLKSYHPRDIEEKYCGKCGYQPGTVGYGIQESNKAYAEKLRSKNERS